MSKKLVITFGGALVIVIGAACMPKESVKHFSEFIEFGTTWAGGLLLAVAALRSSIPERVSKLEKAMAKVAEHKPGEVFQFRGPIDDHDNDEKKTWQLGMLGVYLLLAAYLFHTLPSGAMSVHLAYCTLVKCEAPSSNAVGGDRQPAKEGSPPAAVS